MSGDFTLDPQRAKMLQEKIARQSEAVAKLSQQYTQQKQALLDSWEGTHKEAFVKATNNDFATTAEKLAKNIQQLASNIQIVSISQQKKDQTAASIINNGH